jgi:uncharacterized OB-fold protein
VDVRERAALLAPELAPYLGHGSQAELLMPRCRGCATLVWPPRPSCRRCGCYDFEAIEVAPRGKLYSWVTAYRAPLPAFADLTPYTLIVVTLDVPEGVRVLGRLRETNRTPELRLGLPMHAAREQDSGGWALLLWSRDE